MLYLEAIDELCRDEGGDFDEEVRVTFLHELGHHFGWDEGDLEERGLGYPEMFAGKIVGGCRGWAHRSRQKKGYKSGSSHGPIALKDFSPDKLL
jgi:hypothetical protein